MKRLLDLTISSTGLILFSPLILGTALVVNEKIGQPVLFNQIRPGKDGKPFKLYKFRTMTNETDSEGNLLPDEMRLTKTGQLLRNYSLDELPQLINVLKGDISLVGPRPLLMEYNELYNERQRLRLTVKPGITGWAQVNGRNAISWEEKFELDAWYVENQSFLLDLKILLMTVQKVLKREDINHDGQATMSKFTGTVIND